ncbi:MAG: type II toxin-antitoxin system VapB family antitoxin [Cyclobacteriaceae bacterium]
MKVTAIIDDELIYDAIKYSNSKNTTEAIKIALKEYNNVNRLKELNAQINKQPLSFAFSAEELRELNRKE